MSRVVARRWHVVIGALVVLVALSAKARSAATLLVAVVRPPEPGPMVTEVVTRVRGELVAAGFQVALVDHAPGADPGGEIRSVGNRLHPIAIFGIFEQPEGGAADVWVADLLSGKTLVQRVEAETREGALGKDGSSVQALRAVELLRASLLEIVVERSNLSPPVAPQRRDTAAESPRVCPCEPDGTPSRGGQFGLEAGAAVLHSFEGIGPSVSPILRASYQPIAQLAVRLGAGAFGTQPSIEAREGQARVTQEFGLLELLPIFYADRWVRPFLSIGLGAYHMEAAGSAAPPYEATTQGFWAAAIDGGGGARFSMTRHLGVSLEIHAMLLSGYPMVRIAQADVGRAGRPSMLGSLTLVATP